MIQFDCDEVKRQLNRIAEALPEDEVSIWLITKKGHLEFTCYVYPRGGFESECSTDNNVEVCVSQVLNKTGVRNSEAVMAMKIKEVNEMRAKLAVLESELDPLVISVHNAQESFKQQSQITT